MKITHIETIPVQVPINPQRAIRGGRGYHTVSPFLVLKIQTDTDITGLGEVSCTPGWSGDDQVTAAHFIKNFLAPLLEGEDPTEVERLTQKLRGGVAGNPFTKAGLEMALWDILGKSAGLPLYRLWGGPVRAFVPMAGVYAPGSMAGRGAASTEHPDASAAESMAVATHAGRPPRMAERL